MLLGAHCWLPLKEEPPPRLLLPSVHGGEGTLAAHPRWPRAPTAGTLSDVFPRPEGHRLVARRGQPINALSDPTTTLAAGAPNVLGPLGVGRQPAQLRPPAIRAVHKAIRQLP